MTGWLRWHRTSNALIRKGRGNLPTGILATAAGSYTATLPAAPSTAYDWSDTNLPWTYSNPAVLAARMPAGANVVDLQTGSTDFYTNLSNTVAAAPGRVVVRLPAGVHRLTSFRLAGSSGDPTYSFGFWFPNLQGLFGPAGAANTFVQMDADSMSLAQLDNIAAKTKASAAPNQMGLCRIDSDSSSPMFLSGITFRAADQQMVSFAADNNIVSPQPAPHQGVVLFSNTVGVGVVDHCRFQAAGRAATSLPPFEMANLTSQGSQYVFYNCEFDGRRSPDLDPARPRRCGPIMGNNELSHSMIDCWLHHTNVSRYAINDSNRDTFGTYSLTRCKAEQITNTHNTDPALNGGASLKGYTNATPFGWESVGGTVNVTDCIISQDNAFSDGSVAHHLQFTTVGARNPQGGRLHVSGGEFRNTGFPALNGYLCVRATSSFWVTDGYATTMDVRDADGNPKTAYVVTGAWPPAAATLSAAGVSPATHYLMRNT